MVERGGLENRCTLDGYRGFESHPLRQEGAVVQIDVVIPVRNASPFVPLELVKQDRTRQSGIFSVDDAVLRSGFEQA